MSRVIIFSRTFPSYHPRKGEHTYFVEKIWKTTGAVYEYAKFLNEELSRFSSVDFKFTPKFHTIRAGNRWKVGDKFSPRVWSGKPYRSKQIIIGPDIEVKKVWTFEKGNTDKWAVNENTISARTLISISKNDGLDINDFFAWFNKPMFGQIICWNEKINY